LYEATASYGANERLKVESEKLKAENEGELKIESGEWKEKASDNLTRWRN
jgi:hypothetical protein